MDSWAAEVSPCEPVRTVLLRFIDTPIEEESEMALDHVLRGLSPNRRLGGTAEFVRNQVRGEVLVNSQPEWKHIHG